MQAKKHQLLFKISLLSISIFLMMAPQISPAIPLMYEAFPGISPAGVETLVTIPNFGIMIGLFLSPFLIRFLGQKQTILLGLLVTLFSGTFPMYASDYTLILTSRFILGAGIGLFNSLAVSLIPQFYADDEDERATMLGYQNVMGSLGAALSSFLVGYLVTISWHMAFAIYFLIIPSFILFFLFVPLKKEVAGTAVSHKQKQQLNSKVVVIAILMFFIFLFFMPSAFKLPVLIIEEGFGDASTPALVAGISTLVGIPTGAAFGYLFKKLHDKILPLGFALVTLGFLGISLAPNLVILFLAVLLLGFGFGIAIPYMYNWLGWAAPEGSVNLAMTLVLILVNIGCFLSPTLLGSLSSLFGWTSARGVMYLSTIGYVIIFLYSLGHYFRVHKKL